MKMLNQEEAKRVCDKVMALSKADECRVQISGNRRGPRGQQFTTYEGVRLCA